MITDVKSRKNDTFASESKQRGTPSEKALLRIRVLESSQLEVFHY